MPVKNSILKRPMRKNAAKANQESTDQQWELEQEQLRVLREKRQRLKGIRQVALFGDKQQKAEILEKQKEQIAEHMKLRENLKSQEKQEERVLAAEMASYVQTLNCAAVAEAEARKHYNQQLLSDNQRLAEYRQQLKEQRKQQEIQIEKQLTEEYDQMWGNNVF